MLARSSFFLLLSVSICQAQVALVCQTPQFWCGIMAPGYFHGHPCWCNSAFGPVNGLTIVPYVPNNQTPTPNRADPPPVEEEEEVVVLEPEGEDCLNGLGNCEGAFGQ